MNRFEFYSGAVDKIHGETIPFLKDYTVLTLREPHGVTGHIIPWNYPLAMLGRSLACSFATGNSTVIKTAELTPLSATIFANVAYLFLIMDQNSPILKVVRKTSGKDQILLDSPISWNFTMNIFENFRK